MSGDGTYVPRSPDLSSFFSGPTSDSTSTAEAAPTSAPHSASTGAQPQRPSQQFPSQFSPQQHHQHLHLHTPATSSGTTSKYFADASVTADQRPLQPQRQQYAPPPPQSHLASAPPIASNAPYSPYIPPSPQGHGRTVSDAGLGYTSPQQQHHQRQQSYSAYQPPTFPATATFFAQSASPSYATPAPGRDSPSSGYSSMPPKRGAAAQPPPVIEPSPVKTKFPTARIKRIMQADEDVGKVAQQTPIAVGKALEMFMIQLVGKSADVAREKSSKRVSAAMLKQVVETDPQLDFLIEIVGRVEEEKAGGAAGGAAAGSKRGAKTESESEEEVVEKKKKRGRGKKAAV